MVNGNKNNSNIDVQICVISPVMRGIAVRVKCVRDRREQVAAGLNVNIILSIQLFCHQRRHNHILAYTRRHPNVDLILGQHMEVQH